MTLRPTQSGDVFDVRPLRNELANAKHAALIDTPHLKVKRMVLPAGKELPEHQAPGDMTVQCLEGRIEFNCDGETHELLVGDLIFLSIGEPHSVKALEDTSFLLTIARRP